MSRHGLHFCAEAGSTFYNPDHGKAKETAFELVRMAKYVGADSIKFQLFTADTLYSKKRAPEIYENIKKFEFPVEWLPDLRKCADDVGIELWCSFFNEDYLDAYSYLVDGIKIASGDLTNYSLVEKAARMARAHKIFLAISTGASWRNEIKDTLVVIGEQWSGLQLSSSAQGLVVYHCRSIYPAKPETMNLRSIGTSYSPHFHRSFYRGLSDHTMDSLTAQLATLLNCTYFEKHFRLADAYDNPDNIVALPPQKFREYVDDVLLAREIVGSNISRSVHLAEASKRKWARRGSDGLRPVPDEELD